MLKTTLPVPDRAGVHADERELAHVFVGGDLERQRRQRAVVLRRAFDVFVAAARRLDDGGMSTGEGRKSTMPSSSRWMPLFLKAEPQYTGITLRAIVALRMMPRISSSDRSPVVRNFSSSSSPCSAHFSTRLARHFRAFSILSAGIALLVVRHAPVGVVVVDRLHGDQVNDPREVVFLADRHDDGHGVGAESTLNLLDARRRNRRRRGPSC